MGRKPRAGTVHPKPIVQEALQTTFVLKGTLKRAQLMYLRIGELLVQVRDRKLFEALNHPDMESYARDRLGLGRSSLYTYLKVYDWVRKSHPEWLKPKAGMFIPDLSDTGDLIWIESKLAERNLSSERRSALQKLRAQALAGKLRQADVRAFRKRDNSSDIGQKQLLLKLRRLRKGAAALAGTPPEVLNFLDSAIAVLANEKTLKVAGIHGATPEWNRRMMT